VDLPKRTVDLEAIDAAVARRYRVKAEELKTHAHHACPGKAVAVALAARLANSSVPRDRRALRGWFFGGRRHWAANG